MDADLSAVMTVDIPGVPVLVPGDAQYDEARTVWNAMIDECPAAIASCRSAEDVAEAVNAARAAGLPISIRGGGHNIAGSAVKTGALTIDLSQMRKVAVDPKRRIARVEGGALLADLDRAAQAHGLATPAGVVSDTGVAGLTLGGGFGWLSRLHGLAADNLLSVDLVLADGRFIEASAEDESELFWALRGGSGNFGVVTAFEFRLHPLPDDVLFGPTFFRLEDGAAALQAWTDFMAEAPRACTVWADLATAPPAPFLPESVHGEKVVILMQSWAGDSDEGAAVLAPLKGHPAAVGGFVAPRPYLEAQSFLDQTYAKGARNYWGAQNHDTVEAEMIDTLLDLAQRLPTGESDILLCALGGAVDDVAPDATAYPHRGVPFLSSHAARWRDSSQDADMVAWVRDAAKELAPHTRGGAYVNFIAEREGRSDEAYLENRARLEEIKARYDPDNLFCVNQNVRPRQ